MASGCVFDPRAVSAMRCFLWLFNAPTLSSAVSGGGPRCGWFCLFLCVGAVCAYR